MKKRLIFAGLLSSAFIAHSQSPGLQVTSGTNGQSGLKFTNINSSSATGTGSNGKVLAVNTAGDVILVTDQTGGSGTFGGAQNGCSANGNIVELGGLYGSATSAQLLNNRQVPQNNNAVLFSGNQPNDVFQLGGQFNNGSARLYVEQSANGVGAPAWSKGISCFSDVNATTYNNGLHCLTQDKSPSLFAPMNMGAYIESKGRGIQKGARIVTSRTAGATGSTYGVDIQATDGVGTGAVYGANIAAIGGNGNVYGVYSTADGAVQSIGGFFGSNNATGPNSVLSIGVQGFAGNNPVENMGASNSAFGGIYPNSTTYGTWSGAGGGAINYGVKSNGQGNNSINYGVHGYADGSTSKNYGVYGIAGPAGVGSTNYGVYGTAIGNGTNWAGWFDGDVTFNGAVWGSQFGWTGSDSRFKKDINKLTNTTEKLKKINGYTYMMRKDEFKDKNFSDREQIGFIAQELKEVFPQLVNTDKDGYLAVNYQGMIPVLLEVTKEQQTQIEKQESQIENQQQQIDELKALVQSLAGNQNKAGTINGTAVNLSDKNVLVLDQNVPNPFAESTVITYNIPTDFTRAQMIFTTNDGKIIKHVDITEKGAGSLNVFASDLTHGMYSYSLIIDGKTVDTKKMIKE